MALGATETLQPHKLQPYADALSTKCQRYLAGSSLLSNNAELNSTAAKAAAWALKILVVVPLITVCAALDIVWWTCKTITVYPAYCAGAKAHFTDLFLFIITPITAAICALFNHLPPAPWTPLQVAVGRNELDTVKQLLAGGADPNETLLDPPHTPLDIALNHRNEEMVTLLLDHPNIQINNLRKGLHTPLAQMIETLSSVQRNNQAPEIKKITDIIRMLLMKGAIPNKARLENDTYLVGGTALSWFLKSIDHERVPDYFEIVELMLKNDANPNCYDLLQHALQCNLPENIITLMIKKAREQGKALDGKVLKRDPINEPDSRKGTTPLSYALLNPKPESFEALRKNGAQIDLALADDIGEALWILRDTHKPRTKDFNPMYVLSNRVKEWPCSNTLLNTLHEHNNFLLGKDRSAEVRLQKERTDARNGILCSIFDQFAADLNMPRELINMIAEY